MITLIIRVKASIVIPVLSHIFGLGAFSKMYGKMFSYCHNKIEVL